MRKWNSNLTVAENLRASAKQPVVRLSIFGAIAWSMIWLTLSLLAFLQFDRVVVLTYFLTGPLGSFLFAALLAYLVLPLLPFGRAVVEGQAEAAEDGWPRQWVMALPLLVAWLPFARPGDADWVAATSWIEVLVGALAGGRLGIACLAFFARFG